MDFCNRNQSGWCVHSGERVESEPLTIRVGGAICKSSHHHALRLILFVVVIVSGMTL